jgi:hypothetical protein
MCCSSEVVVNGVSSSKYPSSDGISETIKALALKRRCIPCLHFYAFVHVYMMLVKYLFRRGRKRTTDRVTRQQPFPYPFCEVLA